MQTINMVTSLIHFIESLKTQGL